MNQVIQAAAESVQLGWLMGIMTVFFIVWFVGWTWWAFSPRNKEKMEEAAKMPLADGGD
jgi:cbb3-type cytochrome oxidase subunit 3